MKPANNGKPKGRNAFKWLLILLLIAGGVYANLRFQQVDTAYRATAGIFLAAILLGIAYTTSQGRNAWAFVKSSRTEMRKVVWPTRQETVQTALIVVGMVILTAIILWGVDTLFMWLVGLITGQRG